MYFILNSVYCINDHLVLHVVKQTITNATEQGSTPGTLNFPKVV